MEIPKYYLYVSDEKLSMISNQFIEPILNEAQIESNIGGSIGSENQLIKATLNGGIKASQKYRYNRDITGEVKGELQDIGNIGNLGEKEYIFASSKMKMVDSDSKFLGVYWCGEYYPDEYTRCIVLLTGSRHHVCGNYYGQQILPDGKSKSGTYIEVFNSVNETNNKKYDNHSFAENILSLLPKFDEETLSCEFLAKVYRVEKFDNTYDKWSELNMNVFNPKNNLKENYFVFASPIYVALDPNNTLNIESINGMNKVILTSKHYTYLKSQERVWDRIKKFFTAWDECKKCNLCFTNPFFIDEVMYQLFNAGLIKEAKAFYEKADEILNQNGLNTLFDLLEMQNCECKEIIEQIINLADTYIHVKQT